MKEKYPGYYDDEKAYILAGIQLTRFLRSPENYRSVFDYCFGYIYALKNFDILDGGQFNKLIKYIRINLPKDDPGHWEYEPEELLDLDYDKF